MPLTDIQSMRRLRCFPQHNTPYSVAPIPVLQHLYVTFKAVHQDRKHLDEHARKSRTHAAPFLLSPITQTWHDLTPRRDIGKRRTAQQQGAVFFYLFVETAPKNIPHSVKT